MRITRQYKLVIGFVFDPAAWVLSNQHLSNLIIQENDERKGHWDEPPSPVKGVHAQHGVRSRAIGQECSQEGLLEQSRDKDLVFHAWNDIVKNGRVRHKNVNLYSPCWKIDKRRVLQMSRSAHWTMTIAVKNIV